MTITHDGWALKGAVALVTGAAGGIGRATCAALSKAGARVVATDLSGAPIDLEVDLWRTHDVTSAADWNAVAREVTNHFGRLDCLINNAGVSLVESVARTSLDQWRRVSSVNVESVLLSLQAFLPLMLEGGKHRQGGASVVNVSSAAGLRGVPFLSAYCASKGAVTLLTKAAAREFAVLRYPIRVNSVHPGSVDTSMMDSIFAHYVAEGLSPSIEAARQAAHAAPPLGRMATPQEVAASIVFLCSAGASYTTGTELIVDGGALC